jgi:hypothetical protein
MSRLGAGKWSIRPDNSAECQAKKRVTRKKSQYTRGEYGERINSDLGK